jgi:hypothetical protein
LLGGDFFFTHNCVLVYDYVNCEVDFYIPKDNDDMPGARRSRPWESEVSREDAEKATTTLASRLSGLLPFGSGVVAEVPRPRGTRVSSPSLFMSKFPLRHLVGMMAFIGIMAAGLSGVSVFCLVLSTSFFSSWVLLFLWAGLHGFLTGVSLQEFFILLFCDFACMNEKEWREYGRV